MFIFLTNEEAIIMAVTNGVNKDTVAVIAGALAAMGIGFSRIKAIRPAARQSWADSAKVIALRKF